MERYASISDFLEVKLEFFLFFSYEKFELIT